jgi:taurine dioxygenase
MPSFQLEPLKHIGAAVTKLDTSGPIAPSAARALYAAWLEHGVLVFARTGTSPDVQVALSKVFGALEIHPLEHLRYEGHAELAPFGHIKGPGVVIDGQWTAGYLYWHQDTAYTPNLCKGSMLRMITAPEDGGDTLWCDTAKAYDALPARLKTRIATLETLQGLRDTIPTRPWGMPNHKVREATKDDGDGPPLPHFGDFPLVRHPMVVTHPESGRKSLLLSPQGYLQVLGMSKTDGDALFDEIVAHAVQDQFCYRHHWEVNDMVLWDNRRTMHMALGYPYTQKRFALRTTLKGPQPAGRIYQQDEDRPRRAD